MKHSTKTFFIISFALLFVLFPVLAKAQLGLAFEAINILSWIQQLSGGDQTTFNFGSALLSFFTSILAVIAQGILSIGSGLLNWVISPDFMGTTIQNNPVVQSGWETVRNLANVALVFGLVAIAISIILGFQETKAKKALINFIGIALLINFTPVICGVMIDFANKLMGLFLSSGANIAMTNAIETGLSPDIFDFNASPVAPVAYLLFALFASVIYFLYAFVFIARHVVLWILVIVSPIAFASKVLPEGRYIKKLFPSITYWDEWWDNFLQWLVIGIPASFSLYLSNKIIAEMAVSPLVSRPGGDISEFGTLFSFIVPLAFLVVGFFVTISSGGQITEMAAGYGRKAFGKLTAAGAGFATGAYTGAKTQSALTKDAGLAKRAAYTLGGGLYGGVKTGVKEAMTAKIDEKAKVGTAAGLMGMVKSPLEREETKQWVTRRKEDIGLEKRGTAAGMKEKEFKQFKEPMEKLSTDKVREIAAITPVTREDNIKKHQAMQILMDKKDLKDNEIDYLTKNIQLADNYGFSKKEFAKFVPEEAEKLTGGKQTTADVMSKMSAKEKQEKIRPTSLANIFVAANLTEKDRKYLDERGTQQQRDAIESTSTFDGFDFEKHVLSFNQRQIENLFRDLNEEQKAMIKNNTTWVAQANAKIQEFDDLITKLPPNNTEAIAAAENSRRQITKKLDAIFNGLV
ncbi:MAG: hypothetical protein PHO19_00565 [Candidatus Pacebacteria bacterium]|nr:hypothetical protein [Candidatus Paceibacterota bacterium]